MLRLPLFSPSFASASGVRLQFEQVFGDSFAQCDITVASGEEIQGQRRVEKSFFVRDHIVKHRYDFAMLFQMPCDIP